MNISILKYDPTQDSEPHYEEYEVPLEPYMTLLQALVYIDENYEALAYDYSCRGRICGRCAMMLDGVACTACTTPLAEGDHVVEPLQGHPVIRDLIVDKSEFHDILTNLGQRICGHNITVEEIEAPIDYHAVVALNGIERCAHCGVCMASCPVVATSPNDYVGPAGMIAIALRYYDAYDEGDRVTQAVSNGLWNCIQCGKCDEVCPVAEIDHASIWVDLREAASARGLEEKTRGPLRFGVSA